MAGIFTDVGSRSYVTLHTSQVGGTLTGARPCLRVINADGRRKDPVREFYAGKSQVPLSIVEPRKIKFAFYQST